MRGSERWPTLGRGCCWNPFTDVEDGLRGLEGPRPCSRRLKVGTRGRLQRKYQMLSAGSRSIRVPLVHSRKFPRLGRTIMKSVRAICTRSSSSRDSSSSRVTILRAFEIVNTIFREMKWNRKMKNRDRLEFSKLEDSQQLFLLR